MIALDAYERFFAAMPDWVREAEVNAERKNVTRIQVTDGRITGSEAYLQTKYYVRASDERTGMVYTENPEENVEAIIRKAIANAALATTDRPEPMNYGEAPRVIDQTETASVAELLNTASAFEKMLVGAEILSLAASCTERETRTLNSLGYDARSRTVHVQLYVMLSMPRHGMQDSVIETSVSGKTLAEIDLRAFADQALRLCRDFDADGLPPVTISGGKISAVFSGQVVRNILMTAWRAFAAETMATGASCFSCVGERAGSDAFTLINAPSHPLSGEAWPVDSEGSLMTETVVTDHGVICEPLYTLNTAARDGVRTNGCAGRVPCMTGNVPISLSTVPGLFYLKPGGISERELLDEMKDGLYLTYSLDLFHSVNISSGEFSVPCGGVLYKAGKPVGSISQITVAGRLPELFGSIRRVADNLAFDDFYFHNYCIGAPSVLTDGLTFAC